MNNTDHLDRSHDGRLAYVILHDGHDLGDVLEALLAGRAPLFRERADAEAELAKVDQSLNPRVVFVELALTSDSEAILSQVVLRFGRSVKTLESTVRNTIGVSTD